MELNYGFAFVSGPCRGGGGRGVRTHLVALWGALLTPSMKVWKKGKEKEKQKCIRGSISQEKIFALPYACQREVRPPRGPPELVAIEDSEIFDSNGILVDQS